jgi:formylmethanofuran dehydrogenase subunit E
MKSARRLVALLLGLSCAVLAQSDALQRVAAVHGTAGPFAVAGYRMGERALKELGVSRGTFDLDVTHKTPFQVQWSCVADGVQAATGVSVGKLNLRLVETTQDQMETVIKDKATKAEVIFRLKPGFIERFVNLPHDKLAAAGEQVMHLSDEEIFSVEKR